MNNTISLINKSALAFVLFLMLVILLPFRVSATDLWDSYEIPSTRQKPRVVDDALLLTEEEEAALLTQLDELSQKWECNIAVLTVDWHNGTINSFADDYFDYNGFGADYNGSGILFMLSMSDREWAISTSGSAIQAFTDYGQEYMTDRMLPYLRDGEYYDAFVEYARSCDYLLGQYALGTPYDVPQDEPVVRERTKADIVNYIIFSILIGLVIALIPILVMKAQLKTVKPATNASGYQTGQGVSLSRREDHFIRKTLSKTPRPKDNDSRSSSFGGGSSVHTSSSGSSHGGSHGHF